MYLLDTNICIAIIQANFTVVEAFDRHRATCYVPTLVLAELYKGVFCSQRVEENLIILETFISPLAVIDFDHRAAIEFGRIQGDLRRLGKPTGQIDAAIAAIARSRQDIMVTNNTRHFENISNLQLENWLIDS